MTDLEDESIHVEIANLMVLVVMASKESARAKIRDPIGISSLEDP